MTSARHLRNQHQQTTTAVKLKHTHAHKKKKNKKTSQTEYSKYIHLFGVNAVLLFQMMSLTFLKLRKEHQDWQEDPKVHSKNICYIPDQPFIKHLIHGKGRI